MSAQPSNTTIHVHRTVRAYRQDFRHEAVKALTHKLRPLVFSVPSQEILVLNLTLDTTRKGITAYDRTGLPIVLGTRAFKDFDTVETLSGIELPFEIGGDKFVTNDQADLGNDLHQDLRDA